MDKKIPTEEIRYLLVEEPIEKNSQLESEKAKKLVQTNQEKSLLVLITGGAAAGKTIFTKQIKEQLEQNQQEVVTLSLDAYYAYSTLLFQSRDPILHQIFQWKELNQDLELLLAGKPIYLPIYDNSEERKFTRSTTLINSAPVLIVEGMLALFNEEITKKSNLKIYLEVTDKVRLERRLERYKKGLAEGKFQKPIEYEIERFYKGRPKGNQKTYVEPTKQYSDLVVINNDSFEGNMERVIEVIGERLRERINNESNQNKD